MAAHFPRAITTQLGVWTSHPTAFIVVAAYAVLWYILERDTFDWHGVATLATWVMTLFIQRAAHRDTQALQGKVDELIRATSGARNELTTLDQKEPEDIERQRDGTGNAQGRS
jgi:low affinity Fe/Cu permease